MKIQDTMAEGQQVLDEISIMRRPNGTPVLNDPYVLDEKFVFF